MERRCAQRDLPHQRKLEPLWQLGPHHHHHSFRRSPFPQPDVHQLGCTGEPDSERSCHGKLRVRGEALSVLERNARSPEDPLPTPHCVEVRDESNGGPPTEPKAKTLHPGPFRAPGVWPFPARPSLPQPSRSSSRASQQLRASGRRTSTVPLPLVYVPRG